ncbi:MAG: hypothetical protein MI923_23525, partial [Phycisphaerales bacterium]|nr:hypothetical protein [Phycisphaerales bacterium]
LHHALLCSINLNLPLSTCKIKFFFFGFTTCPINATPLSLSFMKQLIVKKFINKTNKQHPSFEHVTQITVKYDGFLCLIGDKLQRWTHATINM